MITEMPESISISVLQVYYPLLHSVYPSSRIRSSSIHAELSVLFYMRVIRSIG